MAIQAGGAARPNDLPESLTSSVRRALEQVLIVRLHKILQIEPGDFVEVAKLGRAVARQ